MRARLFSRSTATTPSPISKLPFSNPSPTNSSPSTHGAGADPIRRWCFPSCFYALWRGCLSTSLLEDIDEPLLRPAKTPRVRGHSGWPGPPCLRGDCRRLVHRRVAASSAQCAVSGNLSVQRRRAIRVRLCLRSIGQPPQKTRGELASPASLNPRIEGRSNCCASQSKLRDATRLQRPQGAVDLAGYRSHEARV